MARPARGALGGRRLRRARSLILFFQGRRLVVENFLSGRRFEVNADAARLLQAFGRWRSVAAASADFPGYAPGSILASAQRLLEAGLLVLEGSAAAREQRALEAWAPWDQAGTYFHFTGRNTRFASTDDEVRASVRHVTRRPMPPIYKDLPGPRLRLPAPSAGLAPGSVGRALLHRRTCREFLPKPISRAQLGAVTALCFGELGRIDAGPYGTLLHRAAPSGGARHPIECYVMAFDVAGVPAGLYHYSVRENALVRLPQRASRERVLEFTWGQEWFSDAAAVFILTACFSRTRWKYRTPRAYRVVLIDVAHACQNLLIVATSLGLGAFSAAALKEPEIDSYLGIDGHDEGALYMAGIGWPDTARLRRAVRKSGLLPGGPA